jgi:hypothetical protein
MTLIEHLLHVLYVQAENWSSYSDLIPEALLMLILVGPLVMPLLTYVARQLPWLAGQFVLISARVLRNEIVKAILLALIAGAGLAGILQYLSP